MGAAILRGLDGEAYDRKYSDKELMRRIGRYFRPYGRKVILIAISVLHMATANAAIPIIVSNGVGVMADGADDGLIPMLTGIIFTIGFSVWGLNWVRRQNATELIADIILAMRKDAFSAAARQDLSFYDEYSSGRIVSRITTDTQEFGEVVILSTDVINQLAVALVLLITLSTIH